MSLNKLLIDTVLDLVPNWYEAECGPYVYKLSIDNYQRSFYTHRKLTPSLSRFLKRANSRFPKWKKIFRGDIPPSLAEMVQESFVYYWLKAHSKNIDWLNLLRYAEFLLRRTYENFPIVRNLVISAGTGTTAITDPCYEKLFDPLAASPRTFIRVDHQLRFINYEQISYDSIQEPDSYQFHPSFLHPITTRLKNGEYSAHLTTKGDFVILDNTGLLAAKRKGRWKVYDVLTFKNSIVDIVGNYWVGCNLFQLIFDLSFRRHGALLVFDEEHQVLPHVVNAESVVAGSHVLPGLAQRTLRPLLSNISLSSKTITAIPTLILQELASIDGALVFDRDQVLAVGAVIEPHVNVLGQIGARTTAALSSYHWGGRPVKVSSDGDVTLFFRSLGPSNKECDARMDFL